MPVKIIESKQVYTGKILNVLNDYIELPDGRTALREIVSHVGAAAIIPVDADGNIIFVRQYRHPAKQEILEIPAGTLEIDEDPKSCALRELEEETGLCCKKLTHLTSMYIAVGYSTEIIHVYLAEELFLGIQNFDDDEFLTIEKYSFQEAIAKIKYGDICDSKTIVAIYAAKEIIYPN